MRPEQRGWAKRLSSTSNWQQEETLAATKPFDIPKDADRLLGGSGVSREAPAPFCERPEVKLLRPTRLIKRPTRAHSPGSAAADASPKTGRKPSKAPAPGLSSPASGSSHAGSQDSAIQRKFLRRSLKADVDDPREQANHDMRFVLKSAFQLLRAARVTKLELIVRASAAEPRPQQAAWAGSRPSASTPRREV